MVSIAKMMRVVGVGILSSAVAAPAFAAPGIDKNYVRSLAAPGKTVLVIEYYDGGGKPVGRKGYASASGFKAISPTEFRVNDKTALRLYGVEACKDRVLISRSVSCRSWCRARGCSSAGPF